MSADKIRTQEYALTMTLKPSLFKLPLQEQIERSMVDIYKFMEYLTAEGLLIAEITKNANIHYHGILTFNVRSKYSTYIEYHIKDLLRTSTKVGFICIKPVTEETKWKQYILKDISATSALINMNPIVYNLKSIDESKGSLEWKSYSPYMTSEEIQANRDLKDR